MGIVLSLLFMVQPISWLDVLFMPETWLIVIFVMLTFALSWLRRSCLSQSTSSYIHFPQSWLNLLAEFSHSVFNSREQRKSNTTPNTKHAERRAFGFVVMHSSCQYCLKRQIVRCLVSNDFNIYRAPCNPSCIITPFVVHYFCRSNAELWPGHRVRTKCNTSRSIALLAETKGTRISAVVEPYGYKISICWRGHQ